jgi:hypothetical protein
VKLWLDDFRAPPDASWRWVKTVADAIPLIESGDVSRLSLDHDLGEYEPTGYDLVKWMEKNDKWPQSVDVHSQNPVGAHNMLLAIRRHFELASDDT